MLLKTNNLNYLIKGKHYLTFILMCYISIISAQEIIEEDESAKETMTKKVVDTSKRFKIDGVA